MLRQCLLIQLLLQRLVNSQVSTYSCRFHIEVTNAGTPELNGIYYDETSELSDGVVYYYKWSQALDDWVLLFRSEDETNNLKYWVFMTVAQLNAANYRDYYLIQDNSAWPPASGWAGTNEDSTYSIGAGPNPTVTKIVSGWVWDTGLSECVRECTSSIPTPSYNCSTLNVNNALAFPQVNGNYTMLDTELSDCVPSYLMTTGDDDEDLFLIYRYFYFGRTWWVMQDSAQLADQDEFVEYYSVESDSITPPSTGWKKTKALVPLPADPGVTPVAATVWEGCSAEEREQQEAAQTGFDLPTPTSIPPNQQPADGAGGTPPPTATPSASGNVRPGTKQPAKGLSKGSSSAGGGVHLWVSFIVVGVVGRLVGRLWSV
jgi:hypothetical protein